MHRFQRVRYGNESENKCSDLCSSWALGLGSGVVLPLEGQVLPPSVNGPLCLLSEEGTWQARLTAFRGRESGSRGPGVSGNRRERPGHDG